MKRIKIFLVVIGVLLLAVGGIWWNIPSQEPKDLQEFFGTPEYESVDIKQPLKEQTVIIEIAGRSFKIPKVYIQSDLRGKRNHDDGINLLYVMPDFKSRADFRNRQEYELAFQGQKMAHMLIKSATKITPPSQIINNRKKNGDMTKYEGNHYGLEKYIDYDDPRHLNIRFDDTYLELDSEGNVVSFISCRTKENVPFPGCNHHFIDKNIYYYIYYNKKQYLSTWKEHQRKAIAFIDSFEMKEERQ